MTPAPQDLFRAIGTAGRMPLPDAIVRGIPHDGGWFDPPVPHRLRAIGAVCRGMRSARGHIPRSLVRRASRDATGGHQLPSSTTVGQGSSLVGEGTLPDRFHEPAHEGRAGSDGSPWARGKDASETRMLANALAKTGGTGLRSDRQNSRTRPLKETFTSNLMERSYHRIWPAQAENGISVDTDLRTLLPNSQ